MDNKNDIAYVDMVERGFFDRTKKVAKKVGRDIEKGPKCIANFCKEHRDICTGFFLVVFIVIEPVAADVIAFLKNAIKFVFRCPLIS